MPKVFLCHSSQDKEFVRRLADDLNARGLEHWFDEKEILVGDRIRTKIEEGLKASDYLAVILSPASIKSEWVALELDAKLIEEIEKRKVTVLPILYESCDVPLSLKGKHYADFRSDYESGLNSLLMRFRQSDRELAAKRKLLQKIAGLPAPVFDPHLLIAMAMANKEFDGAQELIEAHESAHPNCHQVIGPKFIITSSKFQQTKTPELFIESFALAMKLYQFIPKTEHLGNIVHLIKNVPKGVAIVKWAIVGLRNQAADDGKPMNLLITTAFFNVLQKQELNESEKEEIINMAIKFVRDHTLENLRSHLGRVASAGSHIIADMKEPGKAQSLHKEFYEECEKKLEESQDYAQAFLHLGWLAAKKKSSKSAKRWMGLYRIAVSRDEFKKSVSNHSPLSDYVK